MNLSPIVLFVYNRIHHTLETIEALKRNHLAKESNLFIYSDGPKNDTSKTKVKEIRQYLKTISGFKHVEIVERKVNIGLAQSIIDGVSSIVNKYGKVIVLEDDLVTSPYFLTFMNDSLEKYVDDERIISIHGWIYPVNQKLPEVFFLRGADCWGWATWDRGWKLFNSNGQELLNELKRRKLQRKFDLNGTYPYTRMLKGQIRGINDSWAVRWYASAFLANKMTLYPGRSLVHNIGNDNSGTHCGNSTQLDVELCEIPIKLENISVEPSVVVMQAIEEFQKQFRKSILHRFLRKIRFMI